MSKNENKNKLANRLIAQNNLNAQNSLEEALRLTDTDIWNASLSSVNAFHNIKLNLLSLQQILLTYLYKTYGILAKMVDVPVNDAYKDGGFELKAGTIDDEELEELRTKLIKSNDIKNLKQARKWARLYGGAVLVALDGNDLKQPLNLKNLKDKPIEFMALDRWQVTYSKPNIDLSGGYFTVVNYNKLGNTNSNEIHPSRVKILKGKEAPYLINQQVQGWGISIYEQVFQDMSQFFKARNVLFELLDEAKTDVLKLNALQSALGTAQGERALQRMVDMIANNKNYKSQITLSTDDEYEQKQISFAGFDGILKEIRVMMAGSSNMPVNKLWGEGVTGFGSGEDSLENYNASIEAEIRSEDLDVIYWILKIRCHQLFGREIEDLIIEWKSLRVMSSNDEQSLKTSKLDNVLKLFDRQLITPQEVMEILKNERVLLHETKAIKGELEDMDFEKDDDTNT